MTIFMTILGIALTCAGGYLIYYATDSKKRPTNIDMGTALAYDGFFIVIGLITIIFGLWILYIVFHYGVTFVAV